MEAKLLYFFDVHRTVKWWLTEESLKSLFIINLGDAAASLSSSSSILLSITYCYI